MDSLDIKKNYPEQLTHRINPRLARRTFAQFVATRDKRGLEGIQQIYAHIDSRMTDSSYVGMDIELHALISEIAEEEIIVEVAELIEAGSISKENFFNSTIFQGELSKAQIINELKRQNVRVLPCDWGYCVYVKEIAKCGNEDSPVEELRGPEICGNCSNLQLTEKNYKWWNQIEESDRKLLTQENIPKQTKEILKNRISVAQRIRRQYHVRLNMEDSNE